MKLSIKKSPEEESGWPPNNKSLRRSITRKTHMGLCPKHKQNRDNNDKEGLTESNSELVTSEISIYNKVNKVYTDQS